MFKKIKNIKNIVVVSVSLFLIFIIASVIFLVVSNIKMSKKIDDIYDKLNRNNIIMPN